jgi:hypothetical protein
VVTSPGLEIDDMAHCGWSPFDDAKHKCGKGDLVGPALVSELFVLGNSVTDADVHLTRQYIGLRRGLLRPSQLLVVSSDTRTLIESYGLKGFGLEIAHVSFLQQ